MVDSPVHPSSEHEHTTENVEEYLIDMIVNKILVQFQKSLLYAHILEIHLRIQPLIMSKNLSQPFIMLSCRIYPFYLRIHHNFLRSKWLIY